MLLQGRVLLVSSLSLVVNLAKCQGHRLRNLERGKCGEQEMGSDTRRIEWTKLRCMKYQLNISRGHIAVSELCQFIVWPEQCPCGRQVPTLLPVETLLLLANGSAGLLAAGCWPATGLCTYSIRGQLQQLPLTATQNSHNQACLSSIM